MMILLALLTLSTIGEDVLNTTPTLGQPLARCTPHADRVASPAPTNKGGLRKLNEMPAAEPHLAVLRSVDGCPVPVKVRTEVAPRR